MWKYKHNLQSLEIFRVRKEHLKCDQKVWEALSETISFSTWKAVRHERTSGCSGSVAWKLNECICILPQDTHLVATAVATVHVVNPMSTHFGKWASTTGRHHVCAPTDPWCIFIVGLPWHRRQSLLSIGSKPFKNPTGGFLDGRNHWPSRSKATHVRSADQSLAEPAGHS